MVIGAGKIGTTVASLLASAGYRVTLADRSQSALDRIERNGGIRCVPLNIENSADLLGLLNDQFAVINAAPFHLTMRIAEAARAARAHYLDLTEDVASTRRVKELAADANTAFIPQCGLAPGFVSIVAYDLAKRFETLDSVRLRVGALAPVSLERAQLQPDLEHRRRHQRVLRALRSHRRMACGGRCRRWRSWRSSRSTA